MEGIDMNYSLRDNTLVDHLKRRGGSKKRFHLCTKCTGLVPLYFRAIQGHSREIIVDPSLLDNVLAPEDFFEFIYHIGSCFNMHSIVASGLITGGRNHGRDRQTICFTAVDPIDENWVDEQEELDMSQPRHAAYRHRTRRSTVGGHWSRSENGTKILSDQVECDQCP